MDSKQEKITSTFTNIYIVSDFLEDGEIELPRLKELASDGYYFSNSNYMEGLQAFCKGEYFQFLLLKKILI